MTVYFDKLIDNYLPTDSGWAFHPDNIVELPTVESDDKLVIDTTNPLPNAYSQLMFSTTSSTGNAYTYYLNLITSTNGELPQIVKDADASNAKAIEIGANTKLIFKTNYPYNKDRLKKIVCRCRKEAGTTTSLRVGVISVKDEAYITPSGSIGTDDFYDVTVNSTTTVSDTYATYIGYVLDTTTDAYVPSIPDVDFPIPLYEGTTDIALVIEVTDGIGNYYIDSIELQDTENSIADLPNGTLVLDTIEGMSADNKITPVEKNYLVTLMSEINNNYGDEVSKGLYYAGVQAGVSSDKLLAVKTAYDALVAYMYGVDGLLIDMASINTIDGAEFDNKFDTYYAKKVAVEQDTANLNSALLSLSADTTVISVEARGGTLITEQITFTLTGMNINFSDVDWTRSDYGDPEDGFEYMYTALGEIDYTKRWIDCSTVLEDTITITVNYATGNRTLSSTVSLAKILVGTTEPIYLEATDTVPTITEDGALIEGDFFLYIGDYIGNNTPPDPEDLVDEYQKGDKKLAQVPTSEDNEFVFGRIYRFTNQVALPCTVGQTASNSVIISNESAEICAIGLTAFIDSETTRRTIGNITTYNASNKIITFLGGGFQTTTSSNMYIDVWKESRSSTQLSEASADALRIAESTGEWLYVAVLVAQLGLFGTLLIEDKIESTNYASHMEGSGDTAKEVPDMGFKLNGRLGEILAYAMRAYEADIFGNLTASGFKTLQEQAGRTITVASITPNIWKHSEMEALIASQDTLATLSGTIEGYSFNKATRRSNQRVLLASHGYESENISAQEFHSFTKLSPSMLFGNTFYCKFSGYYSGNMSQRTYRNQGSGGLMDLSSSYSVAKTFTANYPTFFIEHASVALWGNKSSHVDYHQVWTNQVFTGLVLVNGGTSFKVIATEPSAYYSNSKTWTIGSYNQNSIDNYCSGTAFYNLFSSLAIGADGFCDGGQINVNGKPYTVTRLTKNANSITFYTSGGVVTVNKFQEGTNVGVYTALAVTQAIKFQKVAGGIETKHIFPWGTQAGTPGSYDIGTNDERFNTAYLSGANIKPAGQSVGMSPLLTKILSYPGIVHSDGTDSNWIRTPSSGLLPYASGGASALGSSSWPFNNGYFKSLDVTGSLAPCSNPVAGSQSIRAYSYYTPPRGLYNSSMGQSNRGSGFSGLVTMYETSADTDTVVFGGDGPYAGTSTTRVYNQYDKNAMTWYYAKF